jgi:hypothetical protein
MQTPFGTEDIAAAKRDFAAAFVSVAGGNFLTVEDRAARAALSLWGEHNNALAIGLWVANVNAGNWINDPEVIALIDEVKTEALVVGLPTKEQVKAEIVAEMRDVMKSKFADPKDRIAAADRLAKVYGIDEKPAVDADDASKPKGFIGVSVTIASPDDFAMKVYRQQTQLQGELIEMSANDVSTKH